MVSWQLNCSLRWQPFTTLLSVELLSTQWTFIICYTPFLWMYVSWLSSRDVSMSHSVSWASVARFSKDRFFQGLSFLLIVMLVGVLRTRRQDNDDVQINVHLKCTLDHEDYTSLRFPFTLPYAWISGRDFCLVGVSCHSPRSALVCFALASMQHV